MGASHATHTCQAGGSEEHCRDVSASFTILSPVLEQGQLGIEGALNKNTVESLLRPSKHLNSHTHFLFPQNIVIRHTLQRYHWTKFSEMLKQWFSSMVPRPTRNC